jgi:hypothetical protein
LIIALLVLPLSSVFWALLRSQQIGFYATFVVSLSALIGVSWLVEQHASAFTKVFRPEGIGRTVVAGVVALAMIYLFVRVLKPDLLIYIMPIAAVLVAIIVALVEIVRRFGLLDATACLPVKLLIATPSGHFRLEQLQPGSLVWAYDEGRAQRVPRRVTRIQKHSPRQVLRICMAGGLEFSATRFHKVLHESGWRKSALLGEGDCLVTVSVAGVSELTSIAAIDLEHPQEVCNIIVDRDFTLICNGVITHNFSFWRRSRCAFHRIFAIAGMRETDLLELG